MCAHPRLILHIDCCHSLQCWWLGAVYWSVLSCLSPLLLLLSCLPTIHKLILIHVFQLFFSHLTHAHPSSSSSSSSSLSLSVSFISVRLSIRERRSCLTIACLARGCQACRSAARLRCHHWRFVHGSSALCRCTHACPSIYCLFSACLVLLEHIALMPLSFILSHSFCQCFCLLLIVLPHPIHTYILAYIHTYILAYLLTLNTRPVLLP